MSVIWPETDNHQAVQLDIIPAPGWDILIWWGNGDEFAEGPLLAWRVETYPPTGRRRPEFASWPVPIPADWSDAQALAWQQMVYVLRDPQGRLHAPGDRDFASLEEAQVWAKAEYATMREGEEQARAAASQVRRGPICD